MPAGLESIEIDCTWPDIGMSAIAGPRQPTFVLPILLIGVAQGITCTRRRVLLATRFLGGRVIIDNLLIIRRLAEVSIVKYFTIGIK